MSDQTGVAGKNQDEFEQTPEGWAAYWTLEIAASRKWLKEWRDGAKVILKAFLDERAGSNNPDESNEATKLNFFWANVTTQRDTMLGQTPEADVSRRYADQDDDEARVAGPVILQRVLNTDIENGQDGYKAALRNCLLDFLTIGFANAWVRYEAEFEEVPEKKGKDGKVLAPAAPRKTHEDAPVDYVYWEDQLWSPCRVYEQMRWSAKKVQMTRQALIDRFGKEIGEAVSLDAQERHSNSRVDAGPVDPWSRADVWEIWDKEHRKVFWWVEGYCQILDVKDDFLKLKDFWPHPRPMMANLTTSSLIPRADYALVQDLYRDINILASRIVVLERALRVAGVYDRNAGDLQRLLTDHSQENLLIAVDGWSDKVSDGGGLESVISWLPLDQVVSALDKLTQKLQEKQQLLYELTGQSDLSRGVENTGGDTPDTATSIRAQVKYGSIRIQARQDEYARWAGELQAIRAEVIVKNYDEATILKRANVLMTPDAPLALNAVRMLKQEFPNYRVAVKSEALALSDFAAMKAERAEFLAAMSGVLRDAAPVVQLFPPVVPAIIETLKWTLAGFRGSSTIEGVWDKTLKLAIQQISQPQQGGQDPEAMKEFAKGQADMVKTQAKLSADIQKLHASVEAERQKQVIQTQANVAQAQMEAGIKTQERQAALQDQRSKAEITDEFARKREDRRAQAAAAKQPPKEAI